MGLTLHADNQEKLKLLNKAYLESRASEKALLPRGSDILR